MAQFDGRCLLNSDIIEILKVIHERTGLDFSLYKEGTLNRRIVGRMRALELSKYSDYAERLRTDPSEQSKLLDAISINVTEMFRNPELFDELERVVFPNIIEEKLTKKHRMIRIWSCGCSTGQEPYSIAIAVSDCIEGSGSKISCSIVATDIDISAITKARAGVFGFSDLKEIGRKRRDKYFIKSGDDFEVAPSIRKMVHFKRHDVVTDRPFRFNDIIFCRNTFIYFNKELQEETQLKLCECLNPGGKLILGMCESLVGAASGKFVARNSALRIYERRIEDYSKSFVASDVLSQEKIDSIIRELNEEGYEENSDRRR